MTITGTCPDLLIWGDKSPGDSGNCPEAWPTRQGVNVTDATCSIDGCAGAKYCRGWCRKHYARWQRTGDPGLVHGERRPEVFATEWDRHFQGRLLFVPSGCWLWTKALNDKGYGVITVSKRQLQYAHRWSYAITHGPIPDGMTVDHLCFEPSCVRPDHLRLLTHAENAANQLPDHQSYCAAGHPFFGPNVYYRPDRKEGSNRVCRECMTKWRNDHIQRKRAVVA